MLRKTETPPDIKTVQTLSYGAFKDVIQFLEGVDTHYKRFLNNSQAEEFRRIYEMGYQKEFGWCVELIESLKRVHQCTETEINEMKQILKKARKQRG